MATSYHGRRGLTLAALLGAFMLGDMQTARAELEIDAQYPGGNIVVERIEGDQVYLRPDLRDTNGWWFYWNFRVRGAAGQTLTFQFTGNNPMGVRGPAVSTDGGRSWSWLGAERVKGASFAYEFSADQAEVRFSFAIPYQEENLRQFLASYRDNPHLSVQELCKSRKGRGVERIHVGQLAGEPDHRIVLTARHHACESMANYVIEGFLDAALDDTDEGKWFREKVEVLVVPFVDKDGVEDGDQGKNRKPHDHNRDYRGDSIYPSVDAIRSFVPTWSKGRLSMAMDMHCPWIRGSHNEVIYMVGNADPAMWQQQVALGKILEEVQQGPLVYRTTDNLPFGTAWNTTGNYGDLMSCTMWATQIEGIRLATSFEIPYANAADRPVTADSARAFGRDLARAVRQYLTD
ncbi:MAG: peptidase M14 [Planctomycetes bacterium]|nr:peptidase M14 [Planctomycetota bacterium]MBL7037975.1 peptidase M14 [Pirellulaceae bacterium]